MLRRLLAMAVLLGFIQSHHPYQIPVSSPLPQYSLYLPLVVKIFPHVDVFDLGEADYLGYPGTVCKFGYLTNNSSSAIYSVTLAIDVTSYPYCGIEPDDCPPSTSTHFTKPKLEATLPNQLNPFSYCLMYSKNYYSFGEVELVYASLTPPGGRVIYPLTITGQLKEGTEWETTVSGTVRNDSGHRLREVRVVGIAGLCSAKEAEIGTTRLDPGAETNYIFHAFYCGWSNPYVPPIEMLEISAQGVAEP